MSSHLLRHPSFLLSLLLRLPPLLPYNPILVFLMLLRRLFLCTSFRPKTPGIMSSLPAQTLSSQTVLPSQPTIQTMWMNTAFLSRPPIPDYGEVVPNPYIQQEIDRSMVPLSVNSDPYEQPRLCQMIGVQNSPAMPITHSASLPQYTPPPHTQSVPQIVPESGINGVFRSVSRAFTRLNRKVTKPSSPQNPPCPYPNASAPAPQYAAYPIGPVSPTQPVPPPYSSYPSPPPVGAVPTCRAAASLPVSRASSGSSSSYGSYDSSGASGATGATGTSATVLDSDTCNGASATVLSTAASDNSASA